MKNFFSTGFYRFYLALSFFFLISTLPAFCSPDKGMTAAELLRQIGIGAVVVAIIGLIVVEFFLKKQIARGSYKWALFIGLFMLPVIAMVSSTTTLMEETTTVESCASCHIMLPFVHDMQEEESASLAARHFKNKWIPKNQCYSCHTSYGIHGTAEAKRDGFRHWLLYVTNTWPDPITFKGSYPNQNCVDCHGGNKKFQEVDSHIALSEKLKANEVSCITCHGPAHPTPSERETPTRNAEIILEKVESEDIQAVANYMDDISNKK